MFKIKEVDPSRVPTPEAGKSIIFCHNGQTYVKDSNGNIIPSPFFYDNSETPELPNTIGGAIKKIYDIIKYNDLYLGTDSDTNTDSDTDNDSDIDSDIDTDTDSDNDVDTDIDTDTDVDNTRNLRVTVIRSGTDIVMPDVEIYSIIDDVETSLGFTDEFGILNVEIPFFNFQIGTRADSEFYSNPTTWLWEGTENIEILMQPVKEFRMCNITVSDSDSSPISLANITIDDIFEGSTNPMGYAAIRVPIGTFNLKISKDGFIDINKNIEDLSDTLTLNQTLYSDIDSDTDIDTDIDVDTDTDIDSDSDVDTDTDVDTDIDSDTDTDTDVDIERTLTLTVTDSITSNPIGNADIFRVINYPPAGPEDAINIGSTNPMGVFVGLISTESSYYGAIKPSDGYDNPTLILIDAGTSDINESLQLIHNGS